jgi:hypothetical protein
MLPTVLVWACTPINKPMAHMSVSAGKKVLLGTSRPCFLSMMASSNELLAEVSTLQWKFSTSAISRYFDHSV